MSWQQNPFHPPPACLGFAWKVHVYRHRQSRLAVDFTSFFSSYSSGCAVCLSFSDGACDLWCGSGHPSFTMQQSSPNMLTKARIPYPPRSSLLSIDLLPYSLSPSLPEQRELPFIQNGRSPVRVVASCPELTLKQPVDPRIPSLVDHPAMGLSHGNPD